MNEILLDLDDESSSVIKVKENDNRQIRLVIYKSGVPYDLTGHSVQLNGSNKLGGGIVQTNGIAISKNTATITMSQDFTRVPGEVYMDATILKAGQQLTTFTFKMVVKKSVLTGANMKPELVIDVLEVLTGLIDESKRIFDAGGAVTKSYFDAQLDDIEQKKADKSEINTLASGKVDKVIGKGLSTNDYTDIDKAEVCKIENKFDKDGIFTMANAGQDIKEAMTGGSVAVVGINTVLEENLVDKQVTPIKTSFMNVSKNLFNINTVVEGRLNYVNGEITVNTSYYVSDYIPVSQSTNYTMSKGYDISYYNSSKTFISGENLLGTTPKTITTPSNCVFARISIHKTSFAPNFYMFAKGNTLPSSYEPFGVNYLPKEFQEKQINLDKSNFTKSFLLSDDLAVGSDLDKIVIDGVHTLVSNGNYINIPSDFNTIESGVLENFNLFKNGNRWVFQRLTSFTSYKKTWTRIVDLQGSATKPWVRIDTSSNTTLNVLCFGDSVTEFGNYPDIISSKIIGTVTNLGFGGTRMGKHSSLDYNAFCFHNLVDSIVSGNFSLQQAEIDKTNPFSPKFKANFEKLKTIDFTKVNLITLLYGTNDYMGTVSGGNVPLGSLGDSNTDSFYGAYNYSINKLLTKYPNIRVILVTPTWRMNHETINGGDTDYVPNNGVYLREYIKAIKDTALKYHVPCVDLFDKSGINVYNKSVYLADTVHPTTEGYKLIGNIIGNFLNSLS